MNELIRKKNLALKYIEIVKSTKDSDDDSNRDWLTIIIPVFIQGKKQLEIFKKCVSSLIDSLSYTYKYEIVLVDDVSPYKEVNNYYDEIPLKVIRNEKNLGFGRSVNKVVNILQKAEILSEYLLILNYDTEVLTQDWYSKILEHKGFLDNTIVGIVLLYPDKKIFQFAGGVISKEKINHYAQFKKIDEVKLSSFPYKVDYITGAFMFLKSEIFLKVGMFDENLRMGYEDSDFGLRARAKNYTLVVIPSIFFLHCENLTSWKENIKNKKDSEIYFWNKWRDNIRESEFCNG